MGKVRDMRDLDHKQSYSYNIRRGNCCFEVETDEEVSSPVVSGSEGERTSAQDKQVKEGIKPLACCEELGLLCMGAIAVLVKGNDGFIPCEDEMIDIDGWAFLRWQSWKYGHNRNVLSMDHINPFEKLGKGGSVQISGVYRIINRK